MKKILSLVLAMALILTAVCALAEGVPSRQDVKPSGSTSDPEIGVVFLDEIPAAAQSAVDAIKAGVDKKDLTGVFGDVTVDGVTNVSEIVAAQFEGECDKVTKEKVLTIQFSTPYEAGTEVKVLIGIIGEDGVAWEQPLNGVVKDNTSIDVTVPAALFNKVLNNPFLIVVCN